MVGTKSPLHSDKDTSTMKLHYNIHVHVHVHVLVHRVGIIPTIYS